MLFLFECFNLRNNVNYRYSFSFEVLKVFNREQTITELNSMVKVYNKIKIKRIKLFFLIVSLFI